MKNNLHSRFGFVVHDVARLMRWNFDRQSQGLGLTRAQWSVLAYLKRSDGTRQTSLAQLMDIAPITLGRHIDRLEAKGWVVRKDDPDDRRAKRVFLTHKAAPMLASLTKLGQKVRREAMAGISADEEAQVVDVLMRIRDNLSETGGSDND
jgi:DNA-binding MarR family transcriptional regulator